MATLFCGSAGAAVVRIDAYDAGSLIPSASATFVGPIHASMDDNPMDPTDRNYFKFDLSGIRPEGEVVDAYLLLEFPAGAYGSKETLERFDLFEVTSDPTTFGFDFTTCTAHAFSWPVWMDLGDGASYGWRIYRAVDEGTITRINLTDAAIADIDAAISAGGEFVIGGRLSWKTHAGFGTVFPSVAPDTIFLNTASTPESDICYGIPSSWTTHTLVLIIRP